MMRGLMISTFLLLLASGCGPAQPSDDALADFVPPTLAKRDDVRANLERRFDARDIDHDRKLSASELGTARADRIAAADTNHDGVIDRDEFIARGLARFDRQDANHDGMVSNIERDAARADRTKGTP